MSVLTEQLSSAREKKVSRARTDYPKLLMRANCPKKGDAARVLNVCELLGITEQQFEQDAAQAMSIPRMLESITAMGKHQDALKGLAEERRERMNSAPDRIANPKGRMEFDNEVIRPLNRKVNLHASHLHRGREAREQLKLLGEKNWWVEPIIKGIENDGRA